MKVFQAKQKQKNMVSHRFCVLKREIVIHKLIIFGGEYSAIQSKLKIFKYNSDRTSIHKWL